MKIHSNYHYENKTYDIEKDTEEIKKLIDSMVISNRRTICSTGTIIKIRKAVKFQDGSYYPTGCFNDDENRKVILKRISNNLKGVISNGNTITVNGKEFDYVADFDDIITILDFLDLIKKCSIYDLDAVSNDRKLPSEKRRLKEKYFLVGEEKELIEWAVENQIWSWLKEVSE